MYWEELVYLPPHDNKLIRIGSKLVKRVAPSGLVIFQTYVPAFKTDAIEVLKHNKRVKTYYERVIIRPGLHYILCQWIYEDFLTVTTIDHNNKVNKIDYYLH